MYQGCYIRYSFILLAPSWTCTKTETSSKILLPELSENFCLLSTLRMMTQVSGKSVH